MSLLLNSFSAFFIITQLYGLFFRPNYGQTAALTYLSIQTAETYEVPLQSFLPVFAIYDRNGVVSQEDISEYVEWKWSYANSKEEISTIFCEELVDSWTHLNQ